MFKNAVRRYPLLFLHGIILGLKVKLEQSRVYKF